MTKKNLVRAVIVCSVLCLALGTGPAITFFKTKLAPNQPLPRGRRIRFTESRSELPGRAWLNFSRHVQRLVAETLVNGYERGYDEGCLRATGRAPKQPGEDSHTRDLNECPALYPRDKDPVKDSIKYADEITQFYTKYPDDMDVPFHYLGYMLIGSNSKSIDEIHKEINYEP